MAGFLESFVQGANPVAVQQPQAPAAPVEPKEPEPTGMQKYDIHTPVDPKDVKPQFDPSTLFNLDPTKLDEAIGNIDFTQGISQEDAAAIVQGGEGALVALRNIVNGATRQAFKNSTIATTKMVESGISKSLPAVDDRVKNHLRTSEVRASLRESNPAFNSPHAAVMLDVLQDKFIAKYPNASADEITRMATEFLQDFGSQFAPKAPVNPNAPKDTDWERWFEN